MAVALIASLLFSACSLALWFLFFAFYWPYRSLFNEEGRYVDPTSLVVYHEQSGSLAIPALALGALGVFFGLAWRQYRSAKGPGSTV